MSYNAKKKQSALAWYVIGTPPLPPCSDRQLCYNAISINVFVSVAFSKVQEGSISRLSPHINVCYPTRIEEILTQRHQYNAKNLSILLMK